MQRLLRRAMVAALMTAALAAAPAEAAEWFGGVFGGSKQLRSGDRTRIAEREEIDSIRLEVSDAGAINAHPVRLALAQIKPVLAALRWEEQGREPVALFADDEVDFLAAGLIEGLARATPREDVVFLSTGKHAGGFVIPRVGNSGRAFFAEGKLHLLIAETHVNYIGEARGGGLKHKFGYGSRNNAAPVSLALPREVGTLVPGRQDWAMLALSSAAKPEVETPADETVRDDAFFEHQATRLRGLKKLRDDGLISAEEYQLKRRKILDGL